MKNIAGGIMLGTTWFLMVSGAQAENWAQWRGPAFNGSTTETGLPVTWSKTEDVAWVRPLPGVSGATPVVWDDTVFVSSADAQRNLVLLCIDRKDGAVRWQKQISTGDREVGKNNMASPSPVTDGKAVYALYGTGDLAALDFAGNVLWTRNLGKDFGKFSLMWLYGGSPLLFNGKLYVQVLERDVPSYDHATDGNPKRESYLLCLDPQTGKDLWRHIRSTDAAEESQESYATPIPCQGKDGPEIIVIGGDYVTAHKAETGEELWRCAGLNRVRDHWRRVVPSVVTLDGMIFACGPKREPLLAIRDGGQGVVTDTHTAWKFTEATPDVCTPLVYEKRLFVLDGDRQCLAWLDPQSGEKKQLVNLQVRDVFSASPTGADGKIYCISERGTVVVLEAGNECKVLATIPMEEGPCRSSIVASHGQLFIRTGHNLYCIGKK